MPGAGLRATVRGVTAGSVILLAGLLAAGAATLPFSLRWCNVQELDAAVRHPPSFRPVVGFDRFSPPGEWNGTRGELKGLEAAARIAHRATSWFGHDDLGRSLFYRILPGFLVSLAMGLAAAGMAIGIGVAWGGTAALIGGRVDFIMMRFVDVLYGLPYILMVILLRVGLTRPLTALLGGATRGADLVILLLAIGGVSWLTMARVVRGQVLSLRSRPFVEASRACGAGPFHIFRRHLLPNLVGPIAVYATLVVPQAVLQESFLTFLGIGVQQPTPSLGRLAADGVQAVSMFVGYWWLVVFPCGVLVLTLLALNFIGDALRDWYDPEPQGVGLV